MTVSEFILGGVVLLILAYPLYAFVIWIEDDTKSRYKKDKKDEKDEEDKKD